MDRIYNFPMGKEFRMLRGVVRKPMQVWWLRRGVWWSGSLALLLAVYTILMLRHRSYVPRHLDQEYLIIQWCVVLMLLITMLIWLMAALKCRALIETFFRDHSIETPQRYNAVFFRLLFCQAVWLPLLVGLLTGSGGLAGMLLRRAAFQGAPGFSGLTILDQLSAYLVPFAAVLMIMVWLTALFVLLPRSTWSVFVIVAAIAANFVILSPACFLRDLADANVLLYTSGSNQWLTDWGWLVGLLILLGMLLAFRFRAWWLGWSLLTLLVLGITLHPWLMYLAWHGARDPVPMLFQLSANIENGLSGYPQWCLEFVYKITGTTQYRRGSIAEILTQVLWIPTMYVLVYWVVLRHWRVRCDDSDASEPTAG